MARKVLVPRPAAHQLQATLAADLSPPADRSTAQDKASAFAAPRSTPTSTQRTSPLRCHPAASHHASGAKYSPRQGKASAASLSTPTSIHAIGESLDASRLKHCPRQGQCSCCRSQHINFKAGHPSSAIPPCCSSSCQRNTAMPRQGKSSCRVQQG